VHVASDGTVAVTYYDLENATGGGETTLSTTGSFDVTTAPDAGGYFVGDYEGLTASGTTFDPFFVMAQPIATAGLTDPFASTAHNP
jgi:hypothetical protein